MQPTYLRRMFFSPKPSTNQFGETLPPPPCVDFAIIRRVPGNGGLEVRIKGHGLIGCANGPNVSIDNFPSPCICFDRNWLVASFPPSTGPRVRIMVTYGTMVAGDFLIVAKHGARALKRNIRIDDRY